MAKKDIDVVVEEVKIYAVSKKYKVKPFYSVAPWNTNKGMYITGQENLTPEQLAKEPLIIDPLKNIPINNNDTIKLSKKGGEYINDAEYVKYRYLLNIPEIAHSKKEVNNTHFFYLDNREAEAVKELSISKLRASAYAKMADLVSLSDIRDMLFFFGENATNYTQTRGEQALYKKCEENPKAILKYFEDSELNKKITFIKKCLSYGLLKRTENNYLMYGSVMLGANEVEAAAFVYDEKNNNIYVPLWDEVKKREGVK